MTLACNLANIGYALFMSGGNSGKDLIAGGKLSVTETLDVGVVITIAGPAPIGAQLFLKSGTYAPHFRSSSTVPGFEWVNGANSAVIATLTDGGIFRPQALQVAGMDAAGQIRLVWGGYGVAFRNDGATMYFMQTAVNDQYGVWNSFRPFSWNLSNGQTTLNADGSDCMHQGRVRFDRANGGRGEFGMRSDDGTYFYVRGKSSGGGIEFVNSAYNSVVGSMDDNATLHIAGATLGTDGNLYMPWAGNWLSTILNGKIGGAVCNWNTGVGEFGPLAGSEVAARYDIPAPYVVCGMYSAYANGDLRTPGVYLRGVQLRNY